MAREAIATSNFTGTNGDPPANFTALNSGDGTITIDTNRFESNTSFSLLDSRWTGSGTFTDDQYAKCVVTGLSNPGGLQKTGVVARASADTGSGRDMYRAYVLEDNTTAIVLEKIVNGSVTQLNSTNVGAFANGDTVEIECEGTTIRSLRNGTQVASVTDSSLTTGKPGICSELGFGPNTFGDDWEGGNITSGPTYDNSAGVSGTSVTSLETASWTIAGTNRYLRGGTVSSDITPIAPTAIKWGGSGGVSLSLGNSAQFSTFGWLASGGLIAPTAQSSTLHASWASSQAAAALVGISATNVHQSTPTGTVATNSGTGTAASATATVDATTVSGDLVVDMVGTYFAVGGTVTLAVGAGQTSRQELESIGTTTAGGGSTEVATTTTTTMSWSITYSSTQVYAWATHAVGLKVFSAGGAVYPPSMGMLGVGS